MEIEHDPAEVQDHEEGVAIDGSDLLGRCDDDVEDEDPVGRQTQEEAEDHRQQHGDHVLLRPGVIGIAGVVGGWIWYQLFDNEGVEDQKDQQR